VPDPILGSAIEAVLVTRDARLTCTAVLAHCRAHLEEFMVPRQVHFVSALPRTGSGKLKRTELPLCVVSPAYST
jgi:acyl-coenzyme A synthetase/AMP-(fatty) acid ligase